MQEQNRPKIDQSKKKVGHVEPKRYPFSQIKDDKIRIHGKKVKREKVYSYIKDRIDEGITKVSVLSGLLGKSRKQTRRYIYDMASLGLVKINPETRMLSQESRSEYAWLSKDSFGMIPEISKWMDDCIAREVKPKTMRQYLSFVKYICNRIDVNPKDIVSSKKVAIEFWTRFIVAHRKERPGYWYTWISYCLQKFHRKS